MRRCTPSAKVSLRTRIGRAAATRSGTSTKLACSTRFADQGAPPTLRRISTYSIGLGMRASTMLESSQVDSSSRALVDSKNRSRHAGDLEGTVRNHRSSRPRSTGLVGSGGGAVRSRGM